MDFKRTLSSRSNRATQPALSYHYAFVKMQKNPWSPENVDGNIIITVAENTLSAERFLERLNRTSAPPLASIKYSYVRGTEPMREAAAAFLSRTAYDGITLGPSFLSLGCGCGAIIDQLFHVITSPGDVALVPAPYYPAFDNDLMVRDGVTPFPFALDTSGGPEEVRASLDAALESAPGPVRALLLTNPHNPLGTVYTEDHIAAMLRWTYDREIHIVSDEIYANSVWGLPEEEQRPYPGNGLPSSPRAFRSVLHVLQRREEFAADRESGHADSLTHVIWGMSKDFCASGLRMGFLYTHNKAVIAAFGNLMYFAGVSGYLQHKVAEILSDKEWIDSYLMDNRAHLRASFAGLEAALKREGIPYVQAWASMFCYIDLSSTLPEGATFEDERALWKDLVYTHGVLMTPGENCHAFKPGQFRMCFAWVEGAALPVAVERIARCVRMRAENGQGRPLRPGAAPAAEVGLRAQADLVAAISKTVIR